jgi:hypothetical protein
VKIRHTKLFFPIITLLKGGERQGKRIIKKREHFDI